VKHRKIDMVCICSIITAEDEQKIRLEAHVEVPNDMCILICKGKR
jgi:hypothetical protein